MSTRDKNGKVIQVGDVVRDSNGNTFTVKGILGHVTAAAAKNVEIVQADKASSKTDGDTIVWGT